MNFAADDECPIPIPVTVDNSLDADLDFDAVYSLGSNSSDAQLQVWTNLHKKLEITILNYMKLIEKF